MPFTVNQIISEHTKLVTVTSDDSVSTAMDLMVEHDYTQLPVVNSEGKPLGLVTDDSILRALKNFGKTVGEMLIKHALIDVDTYSRDDDIFDLLDDLRDASAVVIVDSENKAIGIVTDYDAMEYFRRRAQDMMYMEDIESALKEYISIAFTNSAGEINEPARNVAVKKAINTDSKTQRQFFNALGTYLAKTDSSLKLDVTLAKETFEQKFLAGNENVKGFEDLAMGEFNQMLIHDCTWPHVFSLFDIDKNSVFLLLDEVRKTRNALFHFRGEISPVQRKQLKFCSDWLNRLRPAINVIPATETDFVLENTNESGPTEEDTHNLVNEEGPDYSTPKEELTIIPEVEIVNSTSRYAPLAIYLQEVPDIDSTKAFSFEDIESIIGDRLPAMARQHRSWWANDSVSHVQSQQWLEVGWRVHRISIADQRVIFARNREREQLYISFFSAAIAELGRKAPFEIKAPSPKGINWQIVAPVFASGSQAAAFILTFGLRSRFRVELYIDTYDKVRNKQVFDQLFTLKREVEADFGEPLSWERLDEKRACRIAMYHDGSITDKQDILDALNAWCVVVMIKMYEALSVRTEQMLSQILPDEK